MQDCHSTNPVVSHILLILRPRKSVSTIVSFPWISDHIDLQDHEAVDLATKQSLLFRTAPLLTLAYNPKTINAP